MTDPATVDAATAPPSGFQVRLANFTGPFDLLLQLIGKHKLDVTEVALHTVTDDFIAYIRAMGDDWDLDEASEFLVVAATLLDLKAARLLPSATVENEEDLALLEARDLLFARLLQYKAFKEAAAHIAGLEAVGSRRYPRAVSLEPQYAEALPDLVLGVGPARLLKLALKAFTPKADPPLVSIAHIHMVRVSVREHANIVRDRLIEQREATFSALCIDCESTLEVVARFLALLELYREDLVSFEQVQALGELVVRWTGPDDAAAAVIEVEEYEGSPAPPDAPDAADPADPANAADTADAVVALGVVDTPDLDDVDLDDVDLDDVDLDDADLDDADLDDLDLGDELGLGVELDLGEEPGPGEADESVDVGQERAGPAGIDRAEADSEVDQ
ncbi:segregation/condensation protein A [Dactylosporangium sp. NBC_01737]|uniref:segregation and condensation protein A n=1 Tax=Dactylosporangium sp. NBC_01737 TaxID=2975959 RepID=UPI002E11A1B0|nr:segregation/condensation protein A [Dactylosporangium sp. NBC_01737]